MPPTDIPTFKLSVSEETRHRENQHNPNHTYIIMVDSEEEWRLEEIDNRKMG